MTTFLLIVGCGLAVCWALVERAKRLDAEDDVQRVAAALNQCHAELEHARKNDHRDAQGRFARKPGSLS